MPGTLIFWWSAVRFGHLGTGAFLRTRANGLDRREFVTHDRNAGIDSTGHGGGTRQDGHDTGQCLLTNMSVSLCLMQFHGLHLG